MYRATVINAVNEDMKKYIDLADNTFKERFQTSEKSQLQRISQIREGIKEEKHRVNNQVGNIR